MNERHVNAKERYEERAAILEFCAAYPRKEAERLARAEVASWLKKHHKSGAGEKND